MADEWSKPVRTHDGDFWSEESRPYPNKVMVTASEVDIGVGQEGASAPRAVVLRLLAAEASDRLGWVWEVANMGSTIGWVAQATTSGVLKFRWMDNGSGPLSTKPSTFGHSPDELVAAQYGVALLEDAMREAGE